MTLADDLHEFIGCDLVKFPIVLTGDGNRQGCHGETGSFSATLPMGDSIASVTANIAGIADFTYEGNTVAVSAKAAGQAVRINVRSNSAARRICLRTFSVPPMSSGRARKKHQNHRIKYPIITVQFHSISKIIECQGNC